jgi:hypothetical protein
MKAILITICLISSSVVLGQEYQFELVKGKKEGQYTVYATANFSTRGIHFSQAGFNLSVPTGSTVTNVQGAADYEWHLIGSNTNDQLSNMSAGSGSNDMHKLITSLVHMPLNHEAGKPFALVSFDVQLPRKGGTISILENLDNDIQTLYANKQNYKNYFCVKFEDENYNKDYLKGIKMARIQAEDISKGNLIVSPNPVATQTELVVKNKNGEQEAILSYELYDLIGNQRGNVAYKSPKKALKLNIANLPRGNYFIKVETSTGTYTKQIIKK